MMDSIDNELRDREVIHVYVRRHWRAMIRPVLTAVLSVAAAVLAGLAVPPPKPIGFIVPSIALTMVIVGGFLPWLSWHRTHYVFTTDRVILQTGVLRRSRVSIELAKIRAIAVHQTVRGRLGGYGSLLLSTPDSTIVLVDVPRVERLERFVAEMAARSRARDDAPLVDDMPRDGESRSDRVDKAARLALAVGAQRPRNLVYAKAYRRIAEFLIRRVRYRFASPVAARIAEATAAEAADILGHGINHLDVRPLEPDEAQRWKRELVRALITYSRALHGLGDHDNALEAATEALDRARLLTDDAARAGTPGSDDPLLAEAAANILTSTTDDR